MAKVLYCYTSTCILMVLIKQSGWLRQPTLDQSDCNRVNPVIWLIEAKCPRPIRSHPSQFKSKFQYPVVVQISHCDGTGVSFRSTPFSPPSSRFYRSVTFDGILMWLFIFVLRTAVHFNEWEKKRPSFWRLFITLPFFASTIVYRLVEQLVPTGQMSMSRSIVFTMCF